MQSFNRIFIYPRYNDRLSFGVGIIILSKLYSVFISKQLKSYWYLFILFWGGWIWGTDIFRAEQENSRKRHTLHCTLWGCICKKLGSSILIPLKVWGFLSWIQLLRDKLSILAVCIIWQTHLALSVKATKLSLKLLKMCSYTHLRRHMPSQTLY